MEASATATDAPFGSPPSGATSSIPRYLTDLLVEPTPGEAIIEYVRLRAREAAEKKAHRAPGRGRR